LRKRIRLNLLKLAADVAHDAHEFVIRHEREDGKAGAHLSGVVVDRADGPGLDQHLHERRAERGVRALPVFSLSRARASSPESLEVSISKCL
jgi:hypothetical protein